VQAQVLADGWVLHRLVAPPRGSSCSLAEAVRPAPWRLGACPRSASEVTAAVAATNVRPKRSGLSRLSLAADVRGTSDTADPYHTQKRFEQPSCLSLASDGCDACGIAEAYHIADTHVVNTSSHLNDVKHTQD